MSSAYEPERIRRQLLLLNIVQMYRLIPARHVGTPLGTKPAPSRFSDRGGDYSVLYAAESVRTAFWESLIRQRFTRRKTRVLDLSELEGFALVTVTAAARVHLVDLRDDGPIRIGAPAAVAHDSNHAAARALSVATYDSVPEADGFLYASRFTGHTCIALFDRAIHNLTALSVNPLSHHADFWDALDDYDITLRSDSD